MSIDCHIHLFSKGVTAVPHARHAPDYDARFAELRELAEPCGVDRFVLVQTSFMGTDNSLLAAHLEQHPESFRGVFILPANTSSCELRRLKANGMAGIRLNLFRTDLNASLDAAQLALIERCSQEGLSVGIHDDAARLGKILGSIDGRAERLVIDHFARPESLPGAQDNPVYLKLLDELARLRAFVKISAPYRARNMDPGRAYERLKLALGEDKLLWASDWPWTENRDYLSYANWCSPPWNEDATHKGSLAAKLTANACSFYGFAQHTKDISRDKN